MPVPMLQDDDPKAEILTFKDGSQLTVTAEMRKDRPSAYRDTCALAVNRVFATVVDAKTAADFPIQPSTRKEVVSFK